jgi:hypothetical protein
MAARMRLCLIRLFIFIVLVVLFCCLFVFPPDCAALVEGQAGVVPSGRAHPPEKRTRKSREKFGFMDGNQKNPAIADGIPGWDL